MRLNYPSWIEFKIELPDDISTSDQDIVDWLEWELHCKGMLERGNPLYFEDIHAMDNSVRIVN
jgi:hypothetical protein